MSSDPGYRQTAHPAVSRPALRRDPAFARDQEEELLLLDPSVLLGNEGFGWLEDVSPDQRARFVISQTFFQQVVGGVEYRAADEALWGPLPGGVARQRLRALLTGLNTFSENDAAGNLPPEVTEVAGRLRSMGSQAAVEQWLYLHSNSLLAARSRKILEHFKLGGAKVVEIAGNGIDDLTWLALARKPGSPETQAPLTKKLRAKAGINVVIIGGVATVGVFVPWAVIPGAIAVFLLQPYMQPA